MHIFRNGPNSKIYKLLKKLFNYLPDNNVFYLILTSQSLPDWIDPKFWLTFKIEHLMYWHYMLFWNIHSGVSHAISKYQFVWWNWNILVYQKAQDLRVYLHSINLRSRFLDYYGYYSMGCFLTYEIDFVWYHI